MKQIVRNMVQVLALGMLLISAACLTGRVNSHSIQTEGKSDPLVLTEEQSAFVLDHAPQLLSWLGFISEKGLPEEYQEYIQNIGKPIPVKLIALDAAAIVYIPTLRTALTYIRMPDGQLDYPNFSYWGKVINRRVDEKGIKDILASSGFDWFLMQAKQGAFKFTQEQLALYENSLKQEMKYLVTDAEIILLPMGPQSYGALTDEKRSLLNRIAEMAIDQAEKSFEDAEKVTITIPNFNVGDPGISVLMEPYRGPGITISISLPIKPENLPILFGRVSNWDTRVSRNGIKDRVVENIKENPLKTFDHIIAGISK